MLFKGNSNKPKHKIPILGSLNEIPIGKEFTILRVNAGYYVKEKIDCLGIILGCSFSRTNRDRSKGKFFNTW
ncbi:MAG: hypothetical protein ACFE94_05450 [Candidatus Hodarchaeota archaeon]